MRLDKMDKKALGQKIYNVCLALTTAILLIVLFGVKGEGNSMETNERISCIRYAVCFYSFVILISGSSILREYLSGEYVKKKMNIKLIILGSSLLIGTLLMILFYKAIVYLAVFMLGLGTLMYVVVPTVTKEEKK